MPVVPYSVRMSITLGPRLPDMTGNWTLLSSPLAPSVIVSSDMGPLLPGTWVGRAGERARQTVNNDYSGADGGAITSILPHAGARQSPWPSAVAARRGIGDPAQGFLPPEGEQDIENTR